MPMTVARATALVAFLSLLGACASPPPAQVASTPELANPANPAWYAGTRGIAD